MNRRRVGLYSVHKVNEGGMGQRTALFLLKEAGIDAKPAYSPYVGHSGLQVFGNKRIQKKALQILFGR